MDDGIVAVLLLAVLLLAVLALAWSVATLARVGLGGLHDVRPLPAPVPCPGRQGLWTVPTELAATIYAQVTP